MATKLNLTKTNIGLAVAGAVVLGISLWKPQFAPIADKITLFALMMIGVQVPAWFAAAEKAIEGGVNAQSVTNAVEVAEEEKAGEGK